MHKWFRNVCSIMLVSVMTAGILAGCGTGSKNSSDTTTATTAAAKQGETSAEKKGIVIDPNKKVTLKFFSGAAVNKTELDATLSDFNTKYPNITVDPVIITGADFADKLKTSIVAGEQIDIIEVGSSTLERANAENIYLPIDEYVKKDGWDVEKEYGDVIKQYTVNNKLYGIPKYLAAAGVWYNKKHFDEMKIAYPTADWTWDEFFELAKKLTVKDASGKTTRYGAFHWNFMTNAVTSTVYEVAMYGGYQFLKDDGSPNLDDPKFKKAAEYFYNATLVDKTMPTLAEITAEKMHYMYDMYKGRWSMLVAGRNTAMFLDIHRMNGQLTAEDDDANIYAIAPLPRWDKNSPKKLSYDNSVGDAVCKNTKNPEEAYVFVKWHTTDSLVLSSKVSHRLPASKQLDTKTLLENWTYYKNKDGQVVKGKDRGELYTAMLDPEIKAIFPENVAKYPYATLLRDAVEKNMTLVMTGEMSIDDAIAKSKTDIQPIYEKEKKKFDEEVAKAAK